MAGPPPPPNHGPYPDVPIEDFVDDIIVDPYDDRNDNSGSRKKNKKDKYDYDGYATKTSQPLYEGCALERLKPPAGETLSWRRCGRRWLPYSQEQLVALVKKHRKQTRAKTADPDFKSLTTNQQGVINRIIDEKKLNEKSKTAEWTLVDVQTDERPVGLFQKEVYRLSIVIKRTDKGNNKNSYATSGSHSYPADDVIDLSVPLEKKKDKNKDKNKRKSQAYVDPIDEHINIDGLGLGDLPRECDNRNHDPYREQQPHWDQWEQQGPNHPPPPAPVAPEWQQQQQNPFDQQQPYPANSNFAGSPRDFTNNNPFQPQPHVAAPGQYDDRLDNRDYIHPHQSPRPGARTRSADCDYTRDRSRSRRRQSHARLPSRRRRHDSGRRDDSLEPIAHKVDRWHRYDDRDSSSSTYDDRSLWSRSADGRHNRSPDTSVYSDDYAPRRDRSKPYHRNSGASDYRPRYRSTRYRDADVEPAYSSYRHGHDRRYSQHSRDFDRDRRPALPHAISYDDYPSGRAAEPRYLPAPPLPRRNAEVFPDKRGDYFERGEYRDWRPPVERERDAFEAGVRAARGQTGYYS